MNKHELALALGRREGITKQEALRRIDLLFSIISDELAQHNDVKIRGFGTFSTTMRLEKVFINPRTQKKTYVPKRYVASFIPSTSLKERIYEGE